MKQLFSTAATLLCLAFAAPASAALAVGSQAPDFSAPGTQGSTAMTIALSELLKKGPVVLYFFPSAFTEGSESHQFADNIDAFRAAGVSVIGMSRDTVDTLAKFSMQESGGKIPMASANESIVDGYNVNDAAQFNTRTTYVIDTSGEIVFVDNDPDDTFHVKSALAFVQAMKK